MKECRLTCITLVVAIFALIISIVNTSSIWLNKSEGEKNLYYSVYKELDYNKQLIDELKAKREGLEAGKQIFFRDFQFRSYSALLGNMSIKEGLAENVMDSYRRLGIIQNAIEVPRTLPPERREYVKKAYNLAFENINSTLISSIKQSISGLKEKSGR